jgi:hydroxymethylpyrimidine/phosphomethylpyrimidine kinase
VTARRPVALTVAGVDSGGGAGVVADAKTFEAHGVWATVAVTAVTAQNTLGVHAWAALDPTLVRAQIEAVVGDLGAQAVKTGMLATAGIVAAVAAAVRDLGLGPLVVDTVLLSTGGDSLLGAGGLEVLRADLLPLARLVTPNLAEAEALVGGAVTDRASMVTAARELVAMGAAAALVKGGHLADDGFSPDCLVTAGEPEPLWLDGPRLAARHTHGTGCTLSAAVTAELAWGCPLPDACRRAKAFVTRAIAAGVDLGAGVGPVDPGAART